MFNYDRSSILQAKTRNIFKRYFYIGLRFVIIAVTCFTAGGCFSEGKIDQKYMEYKTCDLYCNYRNALEYQLSEGRSALRIDYMAINYLALKVEEMPCFFLSKLKDDFFFVKLILQKTRLYEINKVAIEAIPSDKNETKEMIELWTRILSEL